MQILLLLPLVLLVLSIIGISIRKFSTNKAVDKKLIFLWKISCATSTLLAWAFIWATFLVISFVIWILELINEKYFSTMFMLLVGGPFIAFMFSKYNKIYDDYWKVIVTSLESCENLSNEQKESLKVDKRLLLEGSSSERKNLLNKIVGIEEHKVEVIKSDDSE